MVPAVWCSKINSLLEHLPLINCSIIILCLAGGWPVCEMQSMRFPPNGSCL